MAKLTTIAVTLEQHEELRQLADRDGVAMRDLVERFLRTERRRRMGLMLAETNEARTPEERSVEEAIVRSGSRTVARAIG